METTTAINGIEIDREQVRSQTTSLFYQTSPPKVLVPLSSDKLKPMPEYRVDAHTTTISSPTALDSDVNSTSPDDFPQEDNWRNVTSDAHIIEIKPITQPPNVVYIVDTTASEETFDNLNDDFDDASESYDYWYEQFNETQAELVAPTISGEW